MLFLIVLFPLSVFHCLRPFLHIAYGNIHTGAVIINTAFAAHIVTNTATSTAACPISSTASTMPSIYSNIYYPVFLLNLNISAASLLYDCLYVQVCRQHNHAACSQLIFYAFPHLLVLLCLAKRRTTQNNCKYLCFLLFPLPSIHVLPRFPCPFRTPYLYSLLL